MTLTFILRHAKNRGQMLHAGDHTQTDKQRGGQTLPYMYLLSPCLAVENDVSEVN